MRLGVLGGTFDPPHLAHFILAEQVYEQLELDRMLWIPAANPPHKQNSSVTEIRHRLAMLELALQHTDKYELSLIDVERPGPHYTVDTLRMLNQQYPTAELFLIVGADSLCDLPTWRHPQQLLEQAKLVVYARPGIDYDLEHLENTISNLKQALMLLTGPTMYVSSEDIRRRVAAKRSIRYLVLPVVEDYIYRNDLYQDTVK